MRKLFLLTGIILSSNLVLAQSNKTGSNASGVMENMIVAANSNNSFGASATFYNPARPREGSVHLFKNWNNTAVIHTTDDQQFLLKNINLNLERNTFESKIDENEIFTFNFNNIDKFVVNNKIYKNFYWNDDSKVYEVIYEADKFQLLKGYNVTLVEGSANPMLGRKNDRYVKKPHFYLREDGKIKGFKLKKSRVLKLVDGDEAKADKIINYAKDNKLSFKKAYDVKRILEFSAKN